MNAKSKTLVYGVLACCLLSLAACSSDTPEDNIPTGIPIGFSASLEETATGNTRGTRANGTLNEMFVFAYATGTSDFDATSSLANFMWNQQMEKAADGWTYTPKKYWPLNADEKISFCAYAPSIEEIATNGDAMSLSAITIPGYPVITYTNNTAKTDLLISEPILNRTNQNPNINFTLKHALTKVSFQVSNTTGATLTINSITVTARKQATFTWSNGLRYTYAEGSGTATYKVENLGEVSNGTTTADLVTFYLLPDMEDATYSLTYTAGGMQTITPDKEFPTDTFIWAMGVSGTYVLAISN